MKTPASLTALTLALGCLSAAQPHGATATAERQAPASVDMSTGTAQGDEGCGDACWEKGEYVPGIQGQVNAVAAAGDNKAYFGGQFSKAGGMPTNGVALWENGDWIPMNSDTDYSTTVNAITIDPSDGLPIVGGRFSKLGATPAANIAKWTGTQWRALRSGLNGEVRALGWTSQRELIVGGSFTSAGGSSANYVALWNGNGWSSLGTGTEQPVHAVIGSESGGVFAGGDFNTAGGKSTLRIAYWNGQEWSAVGEGLNGTVRSLAFDKNGKLHAGGSFTATGLGVTAAYVAQWTGLKWQETGMGMDRPVRALGRMPNGDLLAGGEFRTADGLASGGVARWDDTGWNQLGTGVWGSVFGLSTASSGRVFVGGAFSYSGEGNGPENTNLNSAAAWDGERWRQLGSGFNAHVSSMALDSDRSPVIAGSFTSAPSALWTGGLVRREGDRWVSLSTDQVFPIAIAPGTAKKIYIVYGFTFGFGSTAVSLSLCENASCLGLASWGTGSPNTVFVDRQSRPIVGIGSRYDSPIGLVRPFPFTAGSIQAHAFDSSNITYLSGNISELSGCGTIKWSEGTSNWTELGADACANVLAVDSAGTPYFLGELPWQGSVIRGAARWENGAWQVLGGGFGGKGPGGIADSLSSLALDSKGGLYVGGKFSSVNGVAANNIAYWNGQTWTALGTGTSERVSAIVVERDGIVNVGGEFTTAGGKPSAYYARWIPSTVRPFVRMSMATYLNGASATSFNPGDLLEARVGFQRTDGTGTANTGIQLKLRNQSGVVVLDSRSQNITIPTTGLNWDYGFALPRTLPAGSYTLSATILREGDYRFEPKELTQVITIQPAPVEDNKKVVVYVHGWQGLPEGRAHRHRCTGGTNRDGLRSYMETPEEDRRIGVPLKDAGFDVYFANYNSDFVSTDAIADNAKCLATQIAEVRQRTGAGKVSLVAHSMGGLVSRAYIEGAGYRGDVARLVTFGSPHDGLTQGFWGSLQSICLKLQPLKHCGIYDPGFNDLQASRVHAFNLARRIPGPDVEYRFIGGTGSVGLLDWPLDPLRDASALVESPNDFIIALRSAAGQADALLGRNSNLSRQPDGLGYESMSTHLTYVDDTDSGKRDAACLRRFFGIAPQANCDLVRPLVGLTAFSPTGSALALKANVDGRAAGVASPIGKATFRSKGWLIDTDIAGCVEIPVKDGRATCYTPFSPTGKRTFRAQYYGFGGLSDSIAELTYLPGSLSSSAVAMVHVAEARGRGGLGAGPAYGSSASSSSAIARVVGSVAPGAQTQYRLVLDGTEASLTLRWTGGIAQLSFRDPDNRVIDQGNIASMLPGASFSSFDYGDQGGAITVRLPGAKPGEWTAMVKETGAAKALNFTLTGLVSSAIQLTLADPASAGAGKSVPILAFLDQADEPILGATGTVSITEAVTVHGAVLAPTGAGQYQAAVKAPATAGSYPIVVTMQGRTATGTRYSREWLGTVTVTSAHISLGGDRSVVAQDPDQDGKYDSLGASGLITVTEAAEYVLQVTAYSPDGQKVAQARSQQQWPVGAWALSLDIPAEDIQASGLDGPYTVRLEAVRVEPLALEIDNALLGTSIAYKAADFVAAPPPSPTPTPLVTPLPSYTPEPTQTSTSTATPSPSPSPSPSASPETTSTPGTPGSPTVTAAPESTPLATATSTGPITPTANPSATPTMLPMPTLPLPTLTPQATASLAPPSPTSTKASGRRRIYLPVARKKR